VSPARACPEMPPVDEWHAHALRLRQIPALRVDSPALAGFLANRASCHPPAACLADSTAATGDDPGRTETHPAH